MTAMGRLLAMAATLLLAGAAGQAHAQSLSGLRLKPTEPTRPAEDPRFGPAAPAKTLRLDGRRWGVKLDLEQPVDREARPRDVEAGAYYRITPSLRVGGAVRLDERAEPGARLNPREQQPRVRLETAFQF